MPKISIIIPAHNEEELIESCLQSIEVAKDKLKQPAEVIVVLNRCTDKTKAIAERYGAKTIVENAKNLSIIRNRGASIASGEMIATIDADSRMTSNMLVEIIQKLSSEEYIGGGTVIKAERLSLGILMSGLMILPYALIQGVTSAGLFWCYRKDFNAIGGFNEKLLSVEDIDFAKRLKVYGKTLGKKFGTIRKAHIVTSCRKFDRYGDWYFFKNPALIKKLFTGTNEDLANKFWYDFKK